MPAAHLIPAPATTAPAAGSAAGPWLALSARPGTTSAAARLA